MNFAIQRIEAGLLRKFDPSDVISFALFLLLPSLLPFARRAGPPILVMTGVFAAVILWREARLGKVLKSYLRNPATLLFMAFMAWAAISLVWSTAPARGGAFVATGLLLAFSFLMISEFPLSGKTDLFLKVGLATGSAVIAIDLLSGSKLLHFLQNGKAEIWRYNMIAVSYSVLSLAMLVHHKWQQTFSTLIVLTFVYMASFLGESETAKTVLFIFPISYLVLISLPVGLVKPLSYCAVAFIFFFAATGMPGLIALKNITPPHYWEQASGDARLSIWSGVADFAYHGLPFGWGVETISSPKGGAYFMAASLEIQDALSHWHPHNNFLQISAELGLPGVLIGFSILLLMFKRNFPQSRPQIAAFVTFVGAVMGIAAISHGFWQSWWWATVLVGWYALTVGAKKQ